MDVFALAVAGGEQENETRRQYAPNRGDQYTCLHTLNVTVPLDLDKNQTPRFQRS
jgi:hypothetical protein